MKIKKIITLLIAAIMVFTLGACGKTSNSNAGEKEANSESNNDTAKAIHINLPESWKFESFYTIITPANSSSGYGITYYLTSFYDTLVQYDENGKLTGSLAEKWSVSEDGKVYTFNIRKGIKFSDGSDLTAEDVAKSLKASPVNLGQYNGSYGKLSTIIQDVKATDDHTVELYLTQPYYSTLRDLCLANPFGIVSGEQLNDDLTVKGSFSTATYGTGPYMYQGDGDGQTYNFVKNPYYWGEAPQVDSFSIKVLADNDAKILALKNGEIDFISGISKISSESYEEMKNSGSFGAKADDNATQTYYIGYNLSDTVFGDKTVREAISMAIDKQNIVDNIYGGLYEKADTFFSKVLPYCDVEQTVYDFDLDKAKALLDKAGYKDNDGDGIREKNGSKMAADFLYQTGSASDDNMVVYICDQLKKIGIQLTPKSAPMMDWYAMITGGKYGLTVFKTQGGYYDPSNVISNIDPAMSMDPIMSQISGFLPGKAQLISEVNSATDEKRIQDIYNTILTAMADNCLNTPIYYTHQVVLYNDKIADYEFTRDANFTAIQNIKRR
ncbi:nickel ABC transporter substrate-binding protein [Ruminiclostridium cellobioparum]|uniref:ABC-type dipeptide transport system, periplasmic component n=1 Tax=Ruminiclostridium cellobioparum subsp. termitidis CT1112 TaxID=1195236 RepID=S0FN43_RUMCE|nr:nickel ABC transporter substrate-binding protein [Ruminiclostridium cellobioparum]EMS73292.1 ABC-type dipeptide transport system, periplasmic component [Ruminiclostridium cellobioparum subsp. termitidis CT1112]